MRGGCVQKLITTNLKICRFLPIWMIVLTTAAVFSGVVFAAGESKTAATETKPEDVPILITADQLVSNNEEKYAEFIGNVKAAQADFVITADTLRIYYEGDLLDTEEKTSRNDDMLKKIVATGNVKIRSDQYNADTENAEYDTQTLTIILTGENSKVFSGKSSITGSKIILHRKDGRVKVLGGKKKRVEATIYSGGKASDAFKGDKSKE